VNNRILGMIGMICAPALLVEALLPGGGENPLVVGTASMVFMAGAFASLLGLWRAEATGTSRWGRGVLIVQLILVTLAFCFGLFEATALVGEEHPLFVVTDLAWPLSMITMNLVGITTAVVGRLPGWRRFALIPCGLAFPVSILLGMLTSGGFQANYMVFIFFGMLALFWAVMGLVVFQSDDAALPAATTAPATA
jgi:uncharacterized membrane protein YiaA